MEDSSPWHIPVVLRYPEKPNSVLVPVMIFTSSRMLTTLFAGLKVYGHLEAYCAALLCQMAENRAPAQASVIVPWRDDDDKVFAIHTMSKTGDIIRIHAGAPDQVFESQRNSALEPDYSLTIDLGEQGDVMLFTYSERIAEGLSKMREDGRLPIWLAGVLKELQNPEKVSVDFECLGEETPVYISKAETEETHRLLHLTTEDALLLS